MGEPFDEEKAVYFFQNCLIRTPEITEFKDSFQDIIWEKEDDEFGGKKHFVLFDDVDFIYDFTIVEESPAYERKIGCAFADPKQEEEQQQ